MKPFHMAGFSLMLLAAMTLPRPAAAGVAMDCEGTIQSWVLGGYYKQGDCRCSNGRPVCTGSTAGSSRGNAGGLSTENAIKLQLFQGVLDGVVNGMFATPPAPKKMKPLPPIDNSSGRGGGALELERQQHFDAGRAELLSDLKGAAFPPAHGDAEALADAARKPFDTASEFKLPDTPGMGGTPFFGDSMPIEDIRLLVEPENDPRVVDLRQAEAFVVGNLKMDGEKLSGSVRKYGREEKGEPIVHPPACTELARKLNGYLDQRERFRMTVDLALEQLNTWESANRNALMTAVKDGLEYFTGQLLEGLARQGEAAERLQRLYDRNAARMVQQGIDVKEIEAKIARLRLLSSAGQASELRSNLSDWQGFIKDGASALLAQLASSNRDVQAMLDDPRMQEYFEAEAPALKSLLDISTIAASNRVFGKWVARKVPVIAGAELAVNQSYNALDWLLSFRRMTEAHRINGTVLAAARSLQTHIDDTYLSLRECR